jgi:hypothetical protein
MWVEITEDYLGGKSGSSLAVEAGNGVRYWKPIGSCWGLLKN